MSVQEQPEDKDALAAMDEWCKRRIARLSEPMNRCIMRGGDLDNPEYHQQLGQHQAYMAMRSFIHGALKAQN